MPERSRVRQGPIAAVRAARWSIVFALGLLFALGLDVFLFARGIVPVPPWMATLALAAVSLPFVHRLPEALGTPLGRLSMIYLLLSLLGFVGPGQGASAWQAVKDSAVAFAYVIAWLLLLRDPGARRAVAAAHGVALVVATALNLYEVSHPMTWSEVLGRSAGVLMNPNLSALAILCALIVVAARTRSAGALAIALSVSAAGILATFSRGGIVLLLVLCIYYALFSGRVGVRSRALVLAATAGTVLGAAVFAPSELLSDPNVSQRLEVLEGNGFRDASAAERGVVLERGLDLFARAPLLGHGPGRAQAIAVGGRAVGTHNEFLALGVDYGMLGLAFFVAFLLGKSRAGTVPVLILLAVSAATFHSLLLNRQVLLAVAWFESALRANARPVDSPVRAGTR